MSLGLPLEDGNKLVGANVAHVFCLFVGSQFAFVRFPGELVNPILESRFGTIIDHGVRVAWKNQR